MDKAVLGIDVGSKGFLALSVNDSWEYYAISEYDLLGLANIISKIKERCDESGVKLVCVMEEIHAIFGSSSKATFSFGKIFGKLQGIVVANKISLHFVQPKVWQKQMWANSDMVKPSINQQRKMKEKSSTPVYSKGGTAQKVVDSNGRVSYK